MEGHDSSSSVLDDPQYAHAMTHRMGTPTPRRGGSKNLRVTLNLPAPLLDRLRNTVYWTPGLTLTALIKGALQEAITDFETKQGHPFPTRLSELKSGRPRKRTQTHTMRHPFDGRRPMHLSDGAGHAN
ncbi:MAG: hypothetical protein U0172_08900 [Nitrospiraceae bacterium]